MPALSESERHVLPLVFVLVEATEVLMVALYGLLVNFCIGGGNSILFCGDIVHAGCHRWRLRAPVDAGRVCYCTGLNERCKLVSTEATVQDVSMSLLGVTRY
jgi:hypothetical protein